MSIIAGLLYLLSGFCVLLIVIGLVAPGYLKDPKTGEIPKRNHMVTGGSVAAVIAFVLASLIAPNEAFSEAAQQATKTAVETSAASLPVESPPTSKAESNAPTIKPPMNLAEARAFAKNTLRVLDETEQALTDGIQLRDEAGIAKHVRRRLQLEIERWPNLIEQYQQDQRPHFAYCRDAAEQLHTLSYTALREQTVETRINLRKDEASYRQNKQQCKDLLATSDEQLLQAKADEDAEIEEKFGGK